MMVVDYWLITSPSYQRPSNPESTPVIILAFYNLFWIRGFTSKSRSNSKSRNKGRATARVGSRARAGARNLRSDSSYLIMIKQLFKLLLLEGGGYRSLQVRFCPAALLTSMKKIKRCMLLNSRKLESQATYNQQIEDGEQHKTSLKG